MEDTLNDYVMRLAEAKSKMNAAEAEVRSVQDALIPLMKEYGKRTVTAGGDDLVIVGTLVEPSTITIDESRLKKTIGARQYRKVCKEVLDKKKLDAAMEDGLVDIADVAQCSTEVERAPYVRITKK